MDVCILSQDGEVVRHRNMPARPEAWRKAMAPSRDAMVIAVACLFPWYGLADLCAQEGLPCVLGHALSRQAIHGGTATNDPIDSQNIAVLLRGGMLPQASVSPAAMRATRDLLRRRMPLMRKRAERLAHIQHTHSPYPLPAIGQQLASKGQRDGVAERCLDPAVPQSVEVDLALMDHDDRRLCEVELTIVQTAKQHHAQALYRRPSVPGLGKIVRLVLLYAMHEITRFPRVQDCVSSCRLGTCAQASAGKRSGTSGNKMGNASRKWACSEAALLFRRHHAQGQKVLARLEKKHAQGKALPILAHQLARAVYDRLTRETVFAMDPLLNGSGSRAGEPAASLDTQGISLNYRPCKIYTPCVMERAQGQRGFSLILRGGLDTCSGSLIYGDGRHRLPCAAPLPNLSLTGEHSVFSPSFA
jgi:transposase